MIRRIVTTILLLSIATSMLLAAEKVKNPQGSFTTLADFDGSANGAQPLYGYPIALSGGNNYGMTNAGGAYDQGAVFQFNADGTVTILYTFCSQVNCTDGAEPFSGPLVVGGNIYGTTYWGGLNGRGTIFELTPAGQLSTLYSFCSQPGCTDGGSPIAGLVQVGGNFYGTTQLGGANNAGTVFEITPAGQMTTLYSFCPQEGCADGAIPWAGLVQATNGNLYGTTSQGGTNGAGTVFEITPTGQMTSLYSFCSQAGCADGAVPYAGLVQATNGNLYGTTVDGGVNGDFGTVFEITPAGQLTTLHGFAYTDGAFPYAGLIQASDGNLYGTTLDGGANGYGTAFGITPAGQLSTLHSFAFTDGAFPYGGLVEDASQNLYGATNFGGAQYDGTIFTLPAGLDRLAERQTGSRKTDAYINTRRHVLTDANDLGPGGKGAADFFSRRPNLPSAPGVRLSGDVAGVRGFSGNKVRIPDLAGAAAGRMRGMTALAGKKKSLGQNLSTVLSFDGANGAFPYFTALVQGTDGNLYGTTEGGGTFDQGYVFKVTPGGTLTTLYTFCSQTNCTDGAEPYSGLVQATNGSLYGTTSVGGANSEGTIFEITPAGQLTTLYNFCSKPGCTDGYLPYAGLVQGTDGNFYGTTLVGGANNEGTVFKITPGGTLTTLYNFCSQGGCTDGLEPYAGLVQGTDGNFYGTTIAGGAIGAGTVFKITPGGALTTLYSFCSQGGCTDGEVPYAELVQGTDGNFYGTTIAGGANGQGTVFKITPSGTPTTLYNFCSQSGCTDGIEPEAGLVQAGGNFYGTTYFAGPNGYGTVFEITPAGQLTTLYGFGLTDGGFLEGGLVLGSNGNLYGMTLFGGSRLDGTIFSLPVAQQQGLTLSCPTFTAQLGVAYNSALTAAGGLAPYTFSIASGSLPPGLTLNTSTGAITGTPTSAGVYNFVAQVVDSQANTVTTNCGIVVSPTPLTLSCPTGMGQVGFLYSSSLTASGGVAPYTFSISGSLPPGLTLNTSTGAITGTPTTAGTYNFTSQVMDSKGNSATASCSITINAAQSCTNNGNLKGNYAFLYQGWSNFSGSGYVLTDTAGSLVFDGNGNITSGQYDQNDPVDGPSQGTLTGTYCVPANNLGTATINGSNGNTTTYAFVLQPNGNGNVIPYDTAAPWDASGIFLKQNTSDFSTSDFTGQYSLGFIGIDNADSRFGVAGAFTANGTGNLKNGVLDGDDGGNYFNGTLSSNNFSVTPSGRGTVSLNVSGVGTGNFAFYVVNSSQLLILQIDPISQGLQSLFSGQIVQQQGLTYSDSDLNGVSVLGLQGLDTSCNPACADASLVFVTWNGSGSLSYSMDDNDGGAVSSSAGSGSYSVGSNGRVSIGGTGNHNPIFYLTGKNAGFEVSSGGSEVQFGSMVSQSGSNFNNNSLSGNYYGGSWELVSSNECGEVDLANLSSGNGNDTNESNCGESPRSKTSSFTYSVSSDGRTVVTSNGFPSGITYIVSPSSDGSGGSFIYLPWEGSTNPRLESFGVVPTTLTLSCPTGSAQVGVAYSSALIAAGGIAPYTFSILSGSLPPGLTLNTSTGAITGTPATAGTYNFTSEVVDSQGNTATSSCSIVVASTTLTLSCPAGTAQVGVAYSSALVGSGGVAPYTFSITSGSLPSGLTLNTSTGAITGTPTTAGTYSFTAQVADSQGNTAISSCSIVVSSPSLTLSCPTGTAQAGVAYSSALTAMGGVAPYTFSIASGALPPGLTLNTSTGAITGTPTTVGTYNFTAQVADSKGNTATSSCSIMVTNAGTNPTTTSLTLSPASVPVGSVGPIVMTATVTPVSGNGTPTGTLTYFNGSTQVGTATLSGGVGTFNYNPSSLAVGIYSITAVYSGDSMFSASSSPQQTLAITQTGPFAYVANINSNTVSVINIPTGQVANNIPVGSGPWGTAISPDQTQVYITNDHGNSVSVINAASGSVLATIPVQSSPFGVAFTPDGSGVYVVNGSSNTVSVINPATQTVVATVPVQNSPVGVAMAPTSNGTFAYVTNSASNTVSVIAVSSSTVVQTIPVGTGPRWVAVSPNSMWAYVENAGSNNVSVISVATNQVTATIPVGTSPFGAAFTPDNSTVYVANSGSNNVSVIDTKSTTVIGTVSGLNSPVQVTLTTDGATAYVTNLNANTVSVIATASNTIVGTVQVGNAPIGVAIAAAPQQTLQITQPLSPTQPNTFNFGSNSYAVQYPPGTQFSNVNMTVTAVEITQAQFQKRVAGTQFANASCIVYGGGAGNCIDDQVTCTDDAGNPIPCPAEAQPTIELQTSFTTSQAIINPGYLTTPIGQNMWKNIFTGYADPTVKGKTQGFSEFIAVDLGATNRQGAAHFELLRPRLPRKYLQGGPIPIAFRLTSVVNGAPVTDAQAGLSVVMVADAKGNPTQTVVFAKNKAFINEGAGKYKHILRAGKYAPGTYTVTIYGDAFPVFQGQFKILR
ncbi:MAG: choice-of-anchor tandem repeat GloVer-containing protein [Terriglobales bacterium]